MSWNLIKFKLIVDFLIKMPYNCLGHWPRGNTQTVCGWGWKIALRFFQPSTFFSARDRAVFALKRSWKWCFSGKKRKSRQLSRFPGRDSCGADKKVRLFISPWKKFSSFRFHEKRWCLWHCFRCLQASGCAYEQHRAVHIRDGHHRGDNACCDH